MTTDEFIILINIRFSYLIVWFRLNSPIIHNLKIHSFKLERYIKIFNRIGQCVAHQFPFAPFI